MKRLMMILLALVVLSGCDVYQEYKSLKGKNQELEQKVKELEQRILFLEQASLKADQDDVRLNVCLQDAQANRERGIQLNGTKHKDGSYSVPIPIMQNIQTLYRDECETCYRRYGRK